MKKAFLTLLFGGVFCCVQAQILTLYDIDSGEPLEGAMVVNENIRSPLLTNDKGQVDISPFAGSSHIQIKMDGYQLLEMSFFDLEESGFRVGMIASSVSLETVVMSASKWRQSTQEVPVKVLGISPREVALQNPQTAADLLGMSGRVFIQKSQQGGGSPMIRGFATNRLLYTIDGVRMNTAIFRGGNIQNVISLDPFATEKAEIVFGPGSVIYGSDAIGGVMSFQTLTPKFSENDHHTVTGKAMARFASINREKTGHFDVQVGWRKWASVTSISSNDFGDLRMGSHGPEEYLRAFYVQRQDSQDVVVANADPQLQRPSGYSQINMMQKIRFSPSEHWDFAYGFHYSETSGYDRYDRHIRYRNGLPRYGEWAYGPQKWMMNNLNLTRIGGGVVFDRMTLRLALQRFEESRIDRDFNQNDRHIRLEKVDAYSVNLDFQKAIGMRHKLHYGAEAVLNQVKSTGIDEDISTGIKVPGPSRYPQADWSALAAYLTDQFTVSQKVVVTAGLRYNMFAMDARFDTTFYRFPFTSAKLNQGALTGSLGTVYRPAEKWILSANAATAFRAPNVDDLGKVFDSEAGAVMVPNPGLKPEYAYSADIGVAKLFGNHVKVDFSGYYTWLENAMVRRDFTLNGQDSIMFDGTLSQVQAIQNAAQAYVWGIQVGLELKLPSGFGFSTDFNYQKGIEELDDQSQSPSRHAAPLFGASRISYNTTRMTLQLYAQYSGEVSYERMPEEEKGKPEIYAVDGNGNPYSPSWYTLNFKAMYKATDHLSISSGLENITDQRYRPYSSGIVAPGRNFILALTVGF